MITSLTRADGILQVPQEQEGIDEGAEVEVRLLQPKERLDHTLILIGSHDNTIDLIANELKGRDSRIHLSSSNVGSLGGLMALRRNTAHFAGSHLLDTQTGTYNYVYVERYLKGTPVRLVQLAMREQGLIVGKDNPKGIKGLEDLLRPDVVFLNRQAGSGTRVLFDYCLQQRGLSAEQVNGYDQEEFTHMSIAVNVLSRRADAGMAIYSSARALDLGFIPIGRERYDLVIAESSWPDLKMRALLDIIVSGSFRQMVTSMGGYDVSNSGRIMGVGMAKSGVKERTEELGMRNEELGMRNGGPKVARTTRRILTNGLPSAEPKVLSPVFSPASSVLRPQYLYLLETGELSRRAEALDARLEKCDLCPRACGVDRKSEQVGYCGVGGLPRVASINLHPWEEPPISGTGGSGTIFFSGAP